GRRRAGAGRSPGILGGHLPGPGQDSAGIQASPRPLSEVWMPLLRAHAHASPIHSRSARLGAAGLGPRQPGNVLSHARVELPRTSPAPLTDVGQEAKDLPQPQLCRALGLEILKPPPVRLSLKSTTAPRTYWALNGSTATSTPEDWANVSSGRRSSKTMAYCIPEQPPCST